MQRQRRDERMREIRRLRVEKGEPGGRKSVREVRERDVRREQSVG